MTLSMVAAISFGVGFSMIHAGSNVSNNSGVAPILVPNTGVPQERLSKVTKPNPSSATVGRTNQLAEE